MAHHTEYGENSDEMDARAGVGALDRISANTNARAHLNLSEQHYAAEEAHQRAMAEIAQSHARLEQAKLLRQETEAKFIADQRAARELRMTNTLKTMSQIDPALPGASAKIRSLREKDPDLFMGKDSLESHFTSLHATAGAHDKVRDERAERDVLEIEKKQKAEELKMSPAELNAKGQLSFKPNSTTTSPAKMEKLRSDFDKNANGYHAMQDAIAQTDAPTPALIERRNFYRNQMVTNGKRLAQSDPSVTDDVNGTIKDAVLSEHNALEATMNSHAGKDKVDPNLVSQINPLKKILGFDLLDPKTGAAAPSGKTPDVVNTTPPVAGGGVAIAPEVPAPGASGGAEVVVNPNLVPPTPAISVSAASPVAPTAASPVIPTAATPVKEEDPAIAIAKKALNDPNASEAHKTAAKAILGL